MIASNIHGQSRTTSVKAGPWSGEMAHVVIDKNSVTLDFGCSMGKIPAKLRVDKKGNFRVNGTYIQGIGGANPPPGIGPTETPVVYSGTVKKNRMTLTIDFPNSERPSPSYELKKGASIRDIPRCP